MLSIVVPAYNEEDKIASTLGALLGYFKDTEIIVVSDGNDNTGRIVDALASRNKSIRLIEYGKRQGKGKAVIEGIKAARGDKILFADADLSCQPSEISKLVHALDDYDVAVASRLHPDSKVKSNFKRNLLGRGFALLVRILFNLRLRDTQCGFKAFRSNAVKPTAENFNTDGFAFDVELLLKLKKRGASIVEIPVVWEQNDSSKVSYRSMVKMFFDLLHLRFSML